MIFLFPRWDMLIPWRVCVYEIPRHQLSKIGENFPQKQLDGESNFGHIHGVNIWTKRGTKSWTYLWTLKWIHSVKSRPKQCNFGFDMLRGDFCDFLPPQRPMRLSWIPFCLNGVTSMAGMMMRRRRMRTTIMWLPWLPSHVWHFWYLRGEWHLWHVKLFFLIEPQSNIPPWKLTYPLK